MEKLEKMKEIFNKDCMSLKLSDKDSTSLWLLWRSAYLHGLEQSISLVRELLDEEE